MTSGREPAPSSGGERRFKINQKYQDQNSHLRHLLRAARDTFLRPNFETYIDVISHLPPRTSGSQQCCSQQTRQRRRPRPIHLRGKTPA